MEFCESVIQGESDRMQKFNLKGFEKELKENSNEEQDHGLWENGLAHSNTSML